MRNGTWSTDTLDVTAQLTGWPTPTSRTFGENLEVELARRARMKLSNGSGNGAGLTTALAAQMVSWPMNSDLNNISVIRANLIGAELTNCTVKIENGGQLNPEHSRWLMGYPADWALSVAMVTLLSRKSHKNSSKP